MPRLAAHPARCRWLITAAVIAFVAWATGFVSFSASALIARCSFTRGSMVTTFVTRGSWYPASMDISSNRTRPDWDFDRGWWRSGGCTSDSLYISTPLWIPFAGSLLMVGIAPLIPVRPSPVIRHQVAPIAAQPTVSASHFGQ